jgi:hypothetical protein
MWKSTFRGNRRPDVDEPSAERVLQRVAETLRVKLPSTWDVTVEAGPRSPDKSAAVPDAELLLRAPDGSQVTIPVETKNRLDPIDVPSAVYQIRRYRSDGEADVGMLVAPYLSPSTRDRLAEAGISYADGTANLRLALDRPAVFIETEGANADPWAKNRERKLRSLRGRAAGRVVRALCDLRPPYGVEQLAERASIPIASVARVFGLLEREALITRAPRGPVTEVRWAELIRRWCQDYAFSKSNTNRTYLEPRGLSALLDRLRTPPLRYAITGSLAASQIAPVTSPRLATLYVADLDDAAQSLELRRAETGGNVLLAEPFDEVAFERTWERDGLMYAALSQVAADLLTGPGRGPAEGEALISWMKGHVDAWRS